jgi:hypothetical protein
VSLIPVANLPPVDIGVKFTTGDTRGAPWLANISAKNLLTLSLLLPDNGNKITLWADLPLLLPNLEGSSIHSRLLSLPWQTLGCSPSYSKKDKATQLQKQKVGNRASTKEKQDEESGNTGSFNFNFAFELVVAHYQKS